MESVWSDSCKLKKRKVLDKDIEVDILIIGGGLTGISTLYNLRNEKLNICLVEQNFIGSGVTSKSTAKINYLQETIYTDIYNKYDKDTAKKYYDSQIYAIEKITEIIKKENINCDFEQAESYTFTNKKEEQISLFTEEQSTETVENDEIQRTIDRINNKFGKSLVSPASLKMISKSNPGRKKLDKS